MNRRREAAVPEKVRDTQTKGCPMDATVPENNEIPNKLAPFPSGRWHTRCGSTKVVVPDCSFSNSETSAIEILGHLRTAGIPYTLLRARPAGGFDGSDLDLLVDEALIHQCRNLLQQRGFVPGPSPSAFKMVMLRYQQGRLLCLDIHWKAAQYGIVYMNASRMLSRRVESDRLFHLSPEDELMHLVFHNFLRKGKLRSSSLEQILTLLQSPLDRRYLEEHLDEFGMRKAFDAVTAWVAARDANMERGARVRRALFRAALRAQPGNLGRYLVRRAGIRRGASSRGGLVALVGPDGSGKSTLVRTLRQRASAIPNLKLDTTYLGPWGQMKLSLVPALRRLGMTPAVQPVGLHVATYRDRRSLRGSIGSLKGYVFYAAIYVELIYRYLTSVFLRVRKGHWVIADRYITDLRYLYKERPIRNYGLVRRLLCAIFPKPDLMIILDNKPEVIVSRKNQLAAGQIETLRHFMLQAAQPYRHEVMTTDRTPEELADHVLNRMLSLRAAK